MKILFFSLLSLLGFSAYALETVGCSAVDRMKLQSFVDETPLLFEHFITKIDDAISDQADLDQSTVNRLRSARKILNCASERAKKLSFKCKDDRGYIMKTLPFIGNEVAVTTYAIYHYNFDIMVGNVIHEATHKCGTNDTDYFWQNKKIPKSNWKSGWDKIASTYDYWAIYGFCIPDVDC